MHGATVLSLSCSSHETLVKTRHGTLAGLELVPIIDLTAFVTGTPRERNAVARAVDDACRRVGFMQVVGHGIAPAVIAAMRGETEGFFARPLEEKRRCAPARPGLNRGYAALGSEALAYSLGVATSRPDLFEAFNIGPDVVPDDDWHRAAPHDYFAPNIWPDQMPALRAAVTRYFDEAARVALMLTDVFALALGLPEHWFRPYVERSTLTLRVLNYERRPSDPAPSDGQMRMGAHTDYGVVTVLFADAAPGLQVLGPEGGWHDVIPSPGALLVNLGDMTAQWTNDRWRSTLHRVVPPPKDERGRAKRRSAAFFLDANYDALIECIPTCMSAAYPAKYSPVLAGEHLIQKLLGPRALTPSTATNTAVDRLAKV
jgi:isopenicillin N synthase-like dioxygenase